MFREATLLVVNRQDWIEAMQLVKERLKKAQQTEDKAKLEATEKSVPSVVPTSTKVSPAWTRAVACVQLVLVLMLCVGHGRL